MNKYFVICNMEGQVAIFSADIVSSQDDALHRAICDPATKMPRLSRASDTLAITVGANDYARPIPGETQTANPIKLDASRHFDYGVL